MHHWQQLAAAMFVAMLAALSTSVPFSQYFTGKTHWLAYEQSVYRNVCLGLRRKTREFMQPGYLSNYVQVSSLYSHAVVCVYFSVLHARATR